MGHRRIVDLSISIEPDLPSDPPMMIPQIDYINIDEIPLDWCYSDGVVLDFRHKADGERITVDDVQKELERIQYEIKPLDIVLIQTGADDAWGTEQYLVRGDRKSVV